ncbi:complement C5 isoform X3 [Rhinichthys klamathensis goyatoka]|uniref:complement C5 isoform X3 n=1 Tax=Rhinichthys klamathensis goyatoka TaxID=3034132 RepID=UPI0024B5EF40|nr:complement C5 isoform X3 [Rhinichthys klamathensis goyatoka]
MARLFLFCIGLLHLFVCITVQENVYLITAPKTLRLDASENVVVQLFGYDQEIIVNLYLKNTLAPGYKEYASQSLKLNAANNYQASATLRIMPIDFPNADRYVYLQAISSAFTAFEKIPVTPVNGFLFIQTDKPLYTPEQEVQVRVYSLNEELRKSRRTVTLTFVDPDGIKVEIIDMADINGAKPLLPPFKIPLKPTYGIWKIEATYADTFKTTATAEFEVKEYVLPSISIHIEPESNYISEENFESFQLKISAKYVHGTPVSLADMFLMFGYSSPEETVMIPATYTRYMLINGKEEVNLNIKTALSSMPNGPQRLSDMKENSFLRVTVLLQETTGGISQEAELSSVKFVETPFTLSLSATPPFIKPGLPYGMRVLVKDPLGKPVKGVSVKIRATITTADNELEDFKFLGHQDTMTVMSRGDGIAYFICNIPDKVKEAEFTFETEDPRWSQAPLKLKAESYISVNHRYLYIDLHPDSSVVEVGRYINIDVFFHYRDYLSLKTFSYQIISRGKVVNFATVKRVSEKRQSLNIKITSDMVPSARLLVYYVLHGEEKAELVADSAWIDVKAKCVNNLNVDISTLNSQYKPKDKLELRVSTKTKEESLVAFSAVDTALYNLKSNDKDPLKKVLQHVERSDLGCGRGGGKNNADVLDRAGLMFITNSNAKAPSAGGACSDIVRQKRSPVLGQSFEAKAQTYGMSKNCCTSGTRSSPTLETCGDRSRRLSFSANLSELLKKRCQRAFLECCEFAMKLRKENADRIILSRGAIDFLLDVMPSQIRSYFPESWLWEEHTSKSGSVSITKNLPDSLTTWELKAVGVFSEGICVSDEKVQVSQDISVDIPLPYSMVRGEQIELRGSVYNQRSSKTQFIVTLTATEGVCVFRGTQQGKRGKPNENKGHIQARSVALVTFYIMALEAGTHTLTFTLTTEWGTESVVKKLKVVPEGIRNEIQSGGRIDPNGVFGTSMRKLELKNVIPPNIVPKSTVDRILTVNGEVLGELLSIINNPEGLKQLTNLPRGNAEMELMSLLPIYYVYHFLDKTEKWDILGKESAASEKELKRKMQAGITSMMSYKLKYEHGFSMWSNKDKSPSTWVTALIVKTFADMHEYVSLESEVLINGIYWLIKNRQNRDGSFFEKSQNNPLKLMGAGADVTEKTVFLTSFVMIGIKNALKVPNVNILAFKNALDHATEYLSSKSKKIESLYVRAIASYALTLVDINSMPAIGLYEKIKQQAQVKGNPATIRFWEDSKYNKDSLKPSGATSKTVETTVYVLLNSLVRGDSTYAKPILNWLTQDQRYGGGIFSTQDSILTLEALTKYSLLASQATLDMVVDIEYKTKGDISRIKLTQQKPVAKPIAVIKNDDIIIKTAMSSGVSFAKLRTVYYGMTESNGNCQFNISIDIHDRVPYSDDPMLLSQRIVACAKYKPHENAIETESGLTVMEINLPTGVIPVQEDLDMYQNGLESQLSNYEILGDKVILQIDSIPSEDFYCVGFRIQEEFETGMSRSSVFRVYEFNDQGSTCMKFYHKQSRKLLRLCEGDQCQCMAAECCNFKSTIDPTITAEQRKNDTCKESMKYVFKVLIESSEASGDFMTYKAKVKAVLKKEQTDDLKTDSEIDFVKKATCIETNFEVGKQYLVMTSESMKIRVDHSYKYKFPLDSHAWVDWWPLESDCRNAACKQYATVLDDFEFDFLLFGCDK